MIPLYSRASDLRLLEPALLSRLNLTPIHSWPAFQRAAASAECSVVLLEWLFVGATFSRLVRFRERFPTHAVVLVTRKDAENARCLKDVVVEEVVWLCEAEHLLPAAIQRASLRGSLQQLAARVAGMEHLPARLREALLHALRSERPPRSIRELAAAVGRDRRTLSPLWRESAHPDAPLRLEGVLDWLLLLQALARRRGGRKWSAVALDLGVHEQTLRRLAPRLTGSALAELAEADLSATTHHFAGLLLESLSSWLG